MVVIAAFYFMFYSIDMSLFLPDSIKRIAEVMGDKF
jgi:hypothetical protein